MKIQLFQLESNHEIHRIARQNNENHEHLIGPCQNKENYEILNFVFKSEVIKFSFFSLFRCRILGISRFG